MLSRILKPILTYVLILFVYQHSLNAANIKIDTPTVGIGQSNLNLNLGTDFYYQPNIPSYFYFGAGYSDYSIGIKIPDNSGTKNDQVRGCVFRAIPATDSDSMPATHSVSMVATYSGA